MFWKEHLKYLEYICKHQILNGLIKIRVLRNNSIWSLGLNDNSYPIHVYFDWIFLNFLNNIVIVQLNWIFVTWIHRLEFSWIWKFKKLILNLLVVFTVLTVPYRLVLDSLTWISILRVSFFFLQCLSCKFSRMNFDRSPRSWKRILRWLRACRWIFASAKTSSGRR